MGKVTKAAQAAADRRFKKKQASKIAEIHRALMAAGFDSLDKQAAVLRLGRSTIWALLHSDKRRGPSNMILKHILALPQLPPKARLKVNEYIQEKRLGLYGHSNLSIRRVRAQFKDGDHLAPKRSLATLAPSSAIRR
jgi:hypothetical protein